MKAIFRRELRSCFTGMSGYVFTGFILLFAGIYTLIYNLSAGEACFERTLERIAYIYLFAIPFLTMRSFTDERHNGTDRLLYSLPVRLSRVITGKFLAFSLVLLLPVSVMALYPIILAAYAKVNLAAAYGALGAFFLLGLSLISIGLFISSLCENQLTSGLLTLTVMLLIFFMQGLADLVPADPLCSFIALSLCVLLLVYPVWRLTFSALFSAGTGLCGIIALYVLYLSSPDRFTGAFSSVARKLGLYERFYTFTGGVFDLTNVVFFLSVMLVFLCLTRTVLERRRWSL